MFLNNNQNNDRLILKIVVTRVLIPSNNILTFTTFLGRSFTNLYQEILKK